MNIKKKKLMRLSVNLVINQRARFDLVDNNNSLHDYTQEARRYTINYPANVFNIIIVYAGK